MTKIADISSNNEQLVITISGASPGTSELQAPVLPGIRAAVLLFSNLNKLISGYFDPKKLVFLDNENKYFLGWPNWYFGYKRSTAGQFLGRWNHRDELNFGTVGAEGLVTQHPVEVNPIIQYSNEEMALKTSTGVCLHSASSYLALGTAYFRSIIWDRMKSPTSRAHVRKLF